LAIKQCLVGRAGAKSLLTPRAGLLAISTTEASVEEAGASARVVSFDHGCYSSPRNATRGSLHHRLHLRRPRRASCRTTSPQGRLPTRRMFWSSIDWFPFSSSPAQHACCALCPVVVRACSSGRAIALRLARIPEESPNNQEYASLLYSPFCLIAKVLVPP